MEILKFEPVLQEKVWGGKKLHQILGKGDGSSSILGETWEISDNKSGQTRVLGGKYGGNNFGDVFQNNKNKILGGQSAFYSKQFPLLFKYIDASDDLSVQVHPGDNSPLGDAKTETWYVVDAPENAEIIVGISSTLTRDKILEILKTERAIEVLNQIPVKAGDVLLIPAGTVHAITKGLVIYEVQQNSDTTFRLYDWGRMGTDGKPRKLHLKEAGEVVDFTVHQKHKIPPLIFHRTGFMESYLVATKYFALVKYSGIKESFQFDLQNKFYVLTCIKGEFILKTNSSEYDMKRGETLLVTANCTLLEIRNVQSEGEFISCFIPDIERDIVQPLLSEGVSIENIKSLGGRTELTW